MHDKVIAKENHCIYLLIFDIMVECNIHNKYVI